MSTVMTPYQVHDGDEDYTWKWLVWAKDPEQAKALCLSWAECGIEDLTCEVCTRLQPKQCDKAYIEADDAVLRDLHARVEGDSSCSTCGLYEMDGKFPVCEDCDQCPDCGCMCLDHAREDVAKLSTENKRLRELLKNAYTVKPLEWVCYGTDEWCASSGTGFTVRRHPTVEVKWALYVGAMCMWREFATPDAAKQEAEKSHHARIAAQLQKVVPS